MSEFFKNSNRIKIAFAALFAIIVAQALFLGKTLAQKDDKLYEVNLVQINTEKDSVDYREMRQNLVRVDETVRKLNGFLASKGLQDVRLKMLATDSTANAVYLSKQTNRYSQYLVDLQNKLQRVPLGIPAEGYISSNFGKRVNPIPDRKLLLAAANVLKNDSSDTGAKKAPAEMHQVQFHKGLDIAAAYGSAVQAAAAGKVIFAGVKGGYGNCVIVSHGNGLATLYGHLSQILVKTNQEVEVGELLAKSGNTGRSTGPHLHYEVHKNNTPVNPKLFLNL